MSMVSLGSRITPSTLSVFSSGYGFMSCHVMLSFSAIVSRGYCIWYSPMPLGTSRVFFVIFSFLRFFYFSELAVG
jgi:hypothetical protein